MERRVRVTLKSRSDFYGLIDEDSGREHIRVPDGEWFCSSLQILNAVVSFRRDRNSIVDGCSHGYLEVVKSLYSSILILILIL